MSYDLSYRGSAGQGRVAVRMYTAGKQDNPLEFWVNPSECQWRIPLRTSIEPVQGGVVHHEWATTGVGIQQATKFDTPVVNFTFQSGLILPNGTKDHNENAPETIAPGLANFYDFLQLLQEPSLLADGTPNYVVINYVSSSFPSLKLTGHFTSEGVQWTDSADQQFMVNNWGASFMVFQSDPPFWQSNSLKARFEKAYFSGGAF